jgi:hypothetical protein
MLIGTLINSLFPGLAAAFALYYWRRPTPTFVLTYWFIYCAVTVASDHGVVDSLPPRHK